MAPATIYLDYNATTPLDPAVREEMLPFLGPLYGNPSSIHHVGRRARAALDSARERVAALWKSQPSEVVFTSGGTESCNLAILGTARLRRAAGKHIITSAIEHHAVLHACHYLEAAEGFHVTRLPPSRDGFITAAAVATALRPDTVLVSIMAANNEIGSIQPVAEIGALCRDRGVVFHTDAIQAFGKLHFRDIHQFNADLVSCCAHKFHGPKGSGALFIRSPLRPDPILHGGAHEHERRAGTENVAAAVGFAEASSRFLNPPIFCAGRLPHLTARLRDGIATLSSLGALLRSPGHDCLSNTVALTVTGCDGVSLLANLDLAGICASSGSACSSGSLEPSHVLLALGAAESEAHSLVRFSLGRETTQEEIDFVLRVLPDVIARARTAA